MFSLRLQFKKCHCGGTAYSYFCIFTIRQLNLHKECQLIKYNAILIIMARQSWECRMKLKTGKEWSRWRRETWTWKKSFKSQKWENWPKRLKMKLLSNLQSMECQGSEKKSPYWILKDAKRHPFLLKWTHETNTVNFHNCAFKLKFICMECELQYASKNWKAEIVAIKFVDLGPIDDINRNLQP